MLQICRSPLPPSRSSFRYRIRSEVLLKGLLLAHVPFTIFVVHPCEESVHRISGNEMCNAGVWVTCNMSSSWCAGSSSSLRVNAASMAAAFITFTCLSSTLFSSARSAMRLFNSANWFADSLRRTSSALSCKWNAHPQLDIHIHILFMTAHQKWHVALAFKAWCWIVQKQNHEYGRWKQICARCLRNTRQKSFANYSPNRCHWRTT